jgi:hypothetical protein
MSGDSSSIRLSRGRPPVYSSRRRHTPFFGSGYVGEASSGRKEISGVLQFACDPLVRSTISFEAHLEFPRLLTESPSMPNSGESLLQIRMLQLSYKHYPDHCPASGMPISASAIFPKCTVTRGMRSPEE